METYEFTASWVHISTSPPSGTRCIVTDGDTVVIGTYAGDVWILEGINTTTPYKIIGWMEAPKPMKKIVSYEEPVKNTYRPEGNELSVDSELVPCSSASLPNRSALLYDEPH